MVGGVKSGEVRKESRAPRLLMLQVAYSTLDNPLTSLSQLSLCLEEI